MITKNILNTAPRKSKEAKSDVEKVIQAGEAGKFAFLYNCSRSKAYSVRRKVNERINKNDKFCEMVYNAEVQVARFEIVS